LQVFVVHGEQYGDPYEHHQHFLAVDQYLKFGLRFFWQHPNHTIFQNGQLFVRRNEYQLDNAIHRDGWFPVWKDSDPT
jgi:hypothetical protein